MAKLAREVTKNAFFQGLAGLIGKVGALVFTIIIARMLLPERFGIYSLTLTIILTIVTISDLGLGTAITRYVSESLIKKNKGKKEARSRFQFLLKFKFFTSLILAFLLFVLAGPISVLFKKDLILPLQIGSIYLLMVSIYSVVLSLFLALQKLKYSAMTETIFEISKIVLVFFFLYLYKNVASVFIAFSISLSIVLVFSFFIINKKYGFLIKGKTEPVEKKRLLIFSGFLALNSLNAVIFTNIDKLMLGYFIKAEFVGLYTAIFTVISGFIGVLGFYSVIFPVFVRLKGEKLKMVFKKTFHYLALIAFPITIGLAFLFLPLLKIFYGQAYVPLEYKSTLLLTSVFLSFLVLEGMLSGLYTVMFNAKERPKWPALVMVIAAIINIVLNFIFIYFLIKINPAYGLIGAAAATLISRCFNLVCLAILSKRKFNILPNFSSISKPILSSLIMLAFLFLLNYFFKLNIFGVIITVIVAASVYLMAIFLIKGIRGSDIKMLADLIKNRK
jgi:O-antigen/teichoic acid export membrane protein